MENGTEPEPLQNNIEIIANVDAVTDLVNILSNPSTWFEPSAKTDFGQHVMILYEPINQLSLSFVVIIAILVYIVILYLFTMIWMSPKDIITDIDILGRFFWSPKSSIEIFNEFIKSKIPGGYQSILRSSKPCAYPESDDDLLARCRALQKSGKPTSKPPPPKEKPKWWAAAPYIPYNKAADDIDKAGDESFSNMDSWYNSWSSSWSKYSKILDRAMKQIILMFYLNKGTIQTTRKLTFINPKNM